MNKALDTLKEYLDIQLNHYRKELENVRRFKRGLIMKLKKLLKHNTNNIVEVRIRKGEEVVFRNSPKKLNENFLNCKIITFCIEEGKHGYENYLIVSIV